MQKSSFLLHLFVKKCNWNWSCHCAVIFLSAHLMWSFRIFLRQEFCELEILDEITELRYGGKLPDHIHGNFRSSLIRTYQKWKGTDYVPPLTHPALKWSIKDPLPLLLVVTDAPWRIIDEKKKSRKKENGTKTAAEVKPTNISHGFVAIKGSMTIKCRKKLKPEEFENLSKSN